MPVFCAIADALPRDLSAAVFMVMHLAPEVKSNLPAIISRSSRFSALAPADRTRIEHGRIYVAPPDRHLTIEDGVVRVLRGPRENRHRPAIDPLFRTAARNYGNRVTAVILSGYLDDGAAGLRAVRALGGYAIVQQPDDATAGQMPESAINYAGADLVLPASEIGPQLVHRVNGCIGGAMKKPGIRKSEASKAVEHSDMPNLYAETPHDGDGVPSPFACPECGGVLWERKEGENVHFRCRVGHAYSISNLRQEQGEAIEAALWAAMRALEEKAALQTRISRSMTDARMNARLREQAQTDRDHAETIRRMLFENGAGEREQKESKSAD